MAKLKAVLSEVPETLKDFYTPNNEGKFILDVEATDGFALENISGLKNSLSAARTERDDAQKTLKKFSDVDLAKYKRMNEKLDEMEKWDPDQKLAEHKKEYETQLKERFDKQTEQFQSAYEKKLNASIEQSERFKNQLSNVMINQKALNVLSLYAAEPEFAEVLLPHVINQMRTVETDNDITVEVFDPKTSYKRLSTQTGSGDRGMSIEELVLEMRDNKKYSPFFKGADANGGGTKGGTPQGIIGNSVSSGNLDAVQANIDDIASGKIKIVG